MQMPVPMIAAFGLARWRGMDGGGLPVVGVPSGAVVENGKSISVAAEVAGTKVEVSTTQWAVREPSFPGWRQGFCWAVGAAGREVALRPHTQA